MAAYERDSVLFDEIQYSFPALAALLYIASRNGNKLTVVDFGGALGSSYFQNRGMLAHLALSWNVVEQSHFVSVGKAEFADGRLHFFSDLEECLASQATDVVLLSSVLQYIEDPFALLAKLAKWRVPFVLIDRTPILDTGIERIVVQTVPPQIYSASYPCRLFAQGGLEAALTGYYDLRYRFDAHIRTLIELGDTTARYNGLFFERRDRQCDRTRDRTVL
jgi:putative methyltransferase (TIGR04325 family)